MKLAICDDDARMLGALGRMIESSEHRANIELSRYSAPEELLAACAAERFDLVFMDIMLGEANGIAVAEKVCAMLPEARVVFITAHLLDFAEKIFAGVRPYGYIGKPVDAAKVNYYLSRVLRELRAAQSTLRVRRRGVEYDLPLSGIHYIESRGRQAFVCCGEEMIGVYDRLDNLAGQLDDRFVRCHQSYIVNLERVTALAPEGFVTDLVSEDEKPVVIRVSRNHLKETRRRYFEFKGRTVL